MCWTEGWTTQSWGLVWPRAHPLTPDSFVGRPGTCKQRPQQPSSPLPHHPSSGPSGLWENPVTPHLGSTWRHLCCPSFPIVCPSSAVTLWVSTGASLPSMVGHHFQSQNGGTGGWPGCLRCRSHEGSFCSVSGGPPSLTSIPKGAALVLCSAPRCSHSHQHLWILWPFLEIVGLGGWVPEKPLLPPHFCFSSSAPKSPAFFFLCCASHLLTPSDVLGPCWKSQPAPTQEVGYVVWHSGSSKSDPAAGCLAKGRDAGWSSVVTHLGTTIRDCAPLCRSLCLSALDSLQRVSTRAHLYGIFSPRGSSSIFPGLSTSSFLIYLLLLWVMLCLHCCAWAFSSYSKWEPLFSCGV